MAFIGRLFVIAFAIFFAMLTAGVAIAIGIVGFDWPGFAGDIVDRMFFWMLVFFGTSFTGAMLFMPMLVLIALAEAFKVRSLLAYAAVGAVLLSLAVYGTSNPVGEELIDAPPPPIPRTTEIGAASGVAFGFVYWLIAGRNAGRWRERRVPSA